MSRVTAVSAALLVVLTGGSACSSGAPAAAPVTSPATTATSAATPSTSSTPGPSASGVPEPGSMQRPATSSGPLSQRSFPTPRRLGAGWRYAVDPGDAEEGYAGNGTPALARSPREIVQTAVPFGCVRRTALPAPTHALEVDYTVRGATAIAVRSRFADAATARAFFTGRAADLRACVGRSASAAIGPLVTGLSTPAPGSVVSDRTPRSDPWRELSVLDGDSVVLLAVQGRATVTTPDVRRLVPAFRR